MSYSWCQAKQWTNTSLNQCNHSSLICIVLSFEFFLNCFEWYLWITHMLNRLISIEVSFIKLTWSALFEILNSSYALLTFTHCIICLILFYNKIELNDTVSNINDLKMLLMSVWKNDEKNFFCSIFVFSSNDSVMWLKSLLFNKENCKSFLSSWLSILTHFAKRQIDFDSLLNSCIWDLKCEHFVSLMTLFLWSLYFR